MNIYRAKLEKLFDEHFIDEPSSEVFDAMNEIIDYAEKAVKLFAIHDVVGQSEQLCPDCGNTGRRLPQTLDSPDGQECECGA